MNKILILYYHEIVNDGEGFSYQKLQISKFKEQMEFLSSNGYHTYFFSELPDKVPEKSIIISFDDGFKSVYQNAAPILKKNKLKSNIYIPTKYIANDPHFMDWNEIYNLRESDLFEFQAHTHSHKDIRGLNFTDFETEILTSNEIFKQKLGYLPNTFCMPFGTYDLKSLKNLKKINNYKFILGSFYGFANLKHTDRVQPRIGISNNDSIQVFIGKLEGKYNWKGILQKARLSFNNLRKKRITKYEY